VNDRGKKGLIDVVLSIPDQKIRKTIESFVASIPAGSFIRSDLIAKAWGPIVAGLDSLGESLPPVASAFVSKAVDYANGFRAVLDITGKTAGAPNVISAEKWVEQLATDAGKRLKDAKDPAEETDILAKIKREFAARKELMEFIKAQTQAPPAQTPPSIKTVGEEPIPVISGLADFFERRAARRRK
jgi:hypothetical protein